MYWLLRENLSSRKSTPREGRSELLLRVCIILKCSFGDNTLLFRVGRRGGLCRAVTKHFSALGMALGWSKVAGLQGWLLFLLGEPNRFTVHSNFGYIDTIALKFCLCKCLKPYSLYLPFTSIYFLRLVARAVLETGLVIVKIQLASSVSCLPDAFTVLSVSSASEIFI